MMVKKLIALSFVLLLAACFFGCAQKERNVAESTQTGNTVPSAAPSEVAAPEQDSGEPQPSAAKESTSPVSEKNEDETTSDAPSNRGDYTLYGSEEQYILVHKDIDFGTFDSPHKAGDSVRMRHSEIITGKQAAETAAIFDYDLMLTQMLTGEDAVQKLQDICSNFEQESYVLENSDLYLLHVSVKYHADSAVKDRLPVDLFAGAVNVRGDYVQKEHRFDIDGYTNLTPNGEGGNWYAVVVPNDTAAKPVIAIGSEMEYPGPVAAVCFTAG